MVDRGNTSTVQELLHCTRIMDEEEAQIVRLHVKGLGANLSELVERNKAIERENRTLRARVSELEAAQEASTIHLREDATTQTEFHQTIEPSPPSSPRRVPNISIASAPPTPTSSPTRAISPVPDQPLAPVQETPPSNIAQPATLHHEEEEVTPAEHDEPEEGDTISTTPAVQQPARPSGEGYHSRFQNAMSAQIPLGLAEALNTELDPATAAALGTVCLSFSDDRGDEDGEEENTVNQSVSRPGMLPSLWHVLARRGRLPSRHQLCDHIIRRTPAAPSDGGRGLGFMLGEIVVRNPV